MENIEHTEIKEVVIPIKEQSNGQKQIAGAILIAGLLIAGAILLKGNTGKQVAVQQVQDAVDITNPANVGSIALDPVTAEDHILGSTFAKVTFVEYADFQCPYCGKFYTEVKKTIINDYIQSGKVKFVYRDYAFLGEESTQAAEAAKCASDQGKFWEYHDYLFSHQAGENQGAFAEKNLESFAKILGLDTTTFNQCLESGTYKEAVALSAVNGTKAGVKGTPKGFIVKDGKVVATIDGAEPMSMVKAKLDQALK